MATKMSKAYKEGVREKKSGKPDTKAHEKKESKPYEKAEKAGMKSVKAKKGKK